MTHDKVSFTREYCKCRRIPYKITGNQHSLLIKGFMLIYCLENLTYPEILSTIDRRCSYNEYGFFESYNKNLMEGEI